MIKPTVGNIVHFWLTASQKEPLAAIITKVHRDDLINLSVFRHDYPMLDLYVDIAINREIRQYPCADWTDEQKQRQALNKVIDEQTKKLRSERAKERN